MEFIKEATGVQSAYLDAVTKILECGVAESGGGGFSYALTRIVLTAPHMFILTLIIILYLIVKRIVMPIFGTIILGACPCFALCCKHYEEDTQLTVQEAIDKGQLQGSKSYDITSNRTYAAMFGLDEENEENDELAHNAEIGRVHDYSLPESDDGGENEEYTADTNDVGLEMVENQVKGKDARSGSETSEQAEECEDEDEGKEEEDANDEEVNESGKEEGGNDEDEDENGEEDTAGEGQENNDEDGNDKDHDVDGQDQAGKNENEAEEQVNKQTEDPAEKNSDD